MDPLRARPHRVKHLTLQIKVRALPKMRISRVSLLPLLLKSSIRALPESSHSSPAGHNSCTEPKWLYRASVSSWNYFCTVCSSKAPEIGIILIFLNPLRTRPKYKVSELFFVLNTISLTITCKK